MKKSTTAKSDKTADRAMAGRRRKEARVGKDGKSSTTLNGKAAGKSSAMVRDLNRPAYFFNRELSWLEFNQRVLEEAQDTSNPVLERLKFLAIVSSNLDEFFEVRVAGLQQQAETQPQRVEADGLNAQQTLDAVAARVQRMVVDQYHCYAEQVVPDLAAAGIHLLTVSDLEPKARDWAERYFREEVFPVLTPLAIDPAHPFPQLLNKSLNLAVVLSIPDIPASIDGMRTDEHHEDSRFAVVQVPRALPRLVVVPPSLTPDGQKIYVFLSSIISQYIDDLFPGLHVDGCYAFRVTRNSELYLDEDEADNLLEAMREHLHRRRRGDAVRLEVQRGCEQSVVNMLLRTFELDPIDLYEVDGPVNLPRLMSVYSAEKRPDLKDPAFTPTIPRPLRNIESSEELFAAIRHEDILLHHPYNSFKSVDDFVTMAADDPQVLAIKQTLYRASGNSPIIKALMRAVEKGKQVTVLVELKARFDEENNIQWARAMEEAGVHVLYGLVGLKTHCKMCMVVRREQDPKSKTSEIRRYVHLSTGNYNEVTARLYTDVGLLTADPDIGEDAAKIFNLLTGMSQFPGLKKLKMAPFGLHDEFKRLIERETAHARRISRNGKARKPANGKDAVTPRIIIKMNSLVDPDIIQSLYRASQAGVQIDLIVRGICCLRPGVPGVSDNIRVRSIIDRFLEHSRIFYFANDGQPEIYCGSADWMPRNFYRRIEVVFPVENPALKARLKDEILALSLADNVKARCIASDGTHGRVSRKTSETPVRSQIVLLERAQLNAHETSPDFIGNRQSAAPGVVPIVPRAAPVIVGGVGEGRAGTQTDVVLQSLAGENKTEPRNEVMDAQEGDKRAESAASSSPVPVDTDETSVEISSKRGKQR